jgi:hypothetical protein
MKRHVEGQCECCKVRDLVDERDRLCAYCWQDREDAKQIMECLQRRVWTCKS